MTEIELQRLADLVAERLRPLLAGARTELVTKTELADMLRVREAQIDRFVRAGMPKVTIGTSPRYDPALCRRWLAEHARPRSTPAPLEALTTPGVTPRGMAAKLPFFREKK
jgi:hypothetical protein